MRDLYILIGRHYGLEAKHVTSMMLDSILPILKTNFNVKIIWLFYMPERIVLETVPDLNKYANCILENSFEYDGTEFDARIHNQFFYSGFLFDVKLSSQEVLSVIEENKATFDKLSSEYIRKINEHKKQQFEVS